MPEYSVTLLADGKPWATEQKTAPDAVSAEIAMLADVRGTFLSHVKLTTAVVPVNKSRLFRRISKRV